MNFEKIRKDIIKKAEKNDLTVSTDTFDLINKTTVKIAGKRKTYDYGGYLIDNITIITETDDNGNLTKGYIGIDVNGNSYKYKLENEEVNFSKCKLYINGMYYCVSECNERDVTERTFKRAIQTFFNRNIIKQPEPIRTPLVIQ